MVPDVLRPVNPVRYSCYYSKYYCYYCIRQVLTLITYFNRSHAESFFQFEEFKASSEFFNSNYTMILDDY